MDYRSRRKLDRLLGDLDVDRQQDRDRERQEQIRKAEHLQRFATAKRTVLRPAMKSIQERLERRGHHTRLHEPRPQLLRLDVLLQATSPIRGRVDVELAEANGDLVFRATNERYQNVERRLPSGDVSDSRVTSILVDLLRALTEAVEPAPPSRPW